MKPTLTVLEGNCLDTLLTMPEQSVQMCVTSPPYWAQRDYKIPPVDWPAMEYVPIVGVPPVAVPAMSCPYGMEPTVHAYIAHSVAIFAQVHRVLRNDGSLWLNLGDKSCSGGGAGHQGKHGNRYTRTHTQRALVQTQVEASGVKAKDVIGLPWRVALALQAAGWYLRLDIIWNKPNPMPESVRDRPTRAHEYMFLMSKRKRYFYDIEATKEDSSPNSHARISQANFANQSGGEKDYGKTGTNPNRSMRKALENFARKNGVNPKSRIPSGWARGTEAERTAAADGADYHLVGRHTAPSDAGRVKQNESFSSAVSGALVAKRNKRSVWTVVTKAFKGSHFATFPPELIRPCIRAGTSIHGCCAECGAPYERIVEKGAPDLEHQRACGGDANGEYNGQSTKDYASAGAQDASATKARILAGMVDRVTVGWRRTCKCKTDERVPCTVLDPFGGAFTTGYVSLQEGRSAIMLEINPEYVAMGRERCAHVKAFQTPKPKKPKRVVDAQLSLLCES